MLIYPDIDPVAFEIGPLKIYWYGISYLCGFLGAYWLILYRAQASQSKASARESSVATAIIEHSSATWSKPQVLDLLFYIALGVIFGGRLGYVLIYEPSQFLHEPLTALAFWVRGRSFHGGLLGVLVAMWIFCRLHKRKFLEVTDFIAPVVPIGLGFGRLGNFINGELWGRVTDVPWGMVFPHAGYYPRHPSQLYEFALEGVLLWIILNIYAAKPRVTGAVSGMFLLCYGIFRFLVEYVREPDFGQGFIILDWFTMGQLLSIPMIIIGAFFLLRRAV